MFAEVGVPMLAVLFLQVNALTFVSSWLAEHPRREVLLLTTPEALTRRSPPAELVNARAVRLRSGQKKNQPGLTRKSGR